MKKITTQKDIDALICVFGGFHDSIIKEIHVFNCEFVDKDGVAHGHPYGFHYDALFLFQRLRPQNRGMAIQILFEKIKIGRAHV